MCTIFTCVRGPVKAANHFCEYYLIFTFHSTVRLFFFLVLLSVFVLFMETAMFVALVITHINLVYPVWHLAMNLNPNDGHIMHYCEGWHMDIDMEKKEEAFDKDYINRTVRKLPITISYIAICRHDNSKVQALRIWKLKEPNRSLLERFQNKDPGGVYATDDILYSYHTGDDHEDPIFSYNGSLVFNWGFTYNGVRITNAGGHLSEEDADDDKTHGLGGNFYVMTPQTCDDGSSKWEHEIGIKYPRYVMGKDHGPGYTVGYNEIGWTANYAIFIFNFEVPMNLKYPLEITMYSGNTFAIF